MHPNPRRIIPLLIILIVVISGGWYVYTTRQAAADNGALSASGTIEAATVNIAPELGGRVADVLVAEGEAVKAGDVIVRFDAALLEAQRAQAEAALLAAQNVAQAAQSAHAAAEANYALLKAGASADQLNAAEAQVAQAEANLAALKANLATLSKARPEEISALLTHLQQTRAAYRQIKATFSTTQIEDVRQALSTAKSHLEQAQSRADELAKNSRASNYALTAARTTVTDVQTAVTAAQNAYTLALDDTQPYFSQVEAARLSWEIARANEAQAQARLTGARADEDAISSTVTAADNALIDAQKLTEDTQAAYDALTSGESAPQLQAAWDEVQRAQEQLVKLGPTTPTFGAPAASTSPAIETLLSQIDAAQAMRDMTAANLSAIRNGARAEQLTAAQAQVQAAQAQAQAAEAQAQAAQKAIETINVQISKLTLTAPSNGVVLARAIEPGEVALPGAALLVLGQLSELNLTVYAPEDRYGNISLGQTAQVTVDSYPGQIFTAQVTHIADQFEFTPRNVQTADGRKTTVFAIKLSIPNADGKLKPGMPADVIFGGLEN